MLQSYKKHIDTWTCYNRIRKKIQTDGHVTIV